MRNDKMTGDSMKKCLCLICEGKVMRRNAGWVGSKEGKLVKSIKLVSQQRPTSQQPQHAAKAAQ